MCSRATKVNSQFAGLLRMLFFRENLRCLCGVANVVMSLYLASIFVSSIVVIFGLLSLSIGDLNSDRQALLAFSAAVAHSKKLNWNPASPVCSSWTGINCTKDGKRVTALRLAGAGLTGTIPRNTLGKLDSLQVLCLRCNLLNGSLPPDVLSLPSLRYLFLQHNSFSSDIPTLLSPQLAVLDLSFNSLTGSIPPTIHNLTRLTALSLNNNSLAGSVPDIGRTRLRHLNVSYNHLNGTIPSSLHKFKPSSFIGNSLCGGPLNSCSDFVLPIYSLESCQPPAEGPKRQPPEKKQPGGAKKKKKKLKLGTIIAIAVGLPIVLVWVLCFKKRKKNKGGALPNGNSRSPGRTEVPAGSEFGSGELEPVRKKFVFFESCSYNFDLEDLLLASAEVLGQGRFGTAYKAALEESVTVVAKRLTEVVVGKKEFEQQMARIGRVGQHPNVVPLRAYYYSGAEKYLLYDYYPGGNLAARLHGNRTAGRNPLDWDARLRISLGAAMGIAHVHSIGDARLTHGNIKSSNVLLTQELDARLSDLGLTPLMNSCATSGRHAGYQAPEVNETGIHTHKSDVYGFGVMLLEILTRKQPIKSPGPNDISDLPSWVRAVVHEEWTAEVFDIEVMRSRKIEEQMVQILQIGLACVAAAPDMRPDMHQIVSMIEQVSLAANRKNKLLDSDVQTQ